MADEREPGQPVDDGTYEPPAVEPIGSAEELAKGNEGSSQDDVNPT
jgi:hypothetical protein